MRGLLIVLLISVGALLVVAVAVAGHVWRHGRRRDAGKPAVNRDNGHGNAKTKGER